MGRNKRTLADELADLANPAPERDPEDDPLGGAAALLESEDEDLDIQKPKRRAKEKPLLLRGDVDVDVDSGVYSGARSSRQHIYGDGDSDTSDNTEHDEDESSDEAEDVSEDEEAPNGEQNNSDHEAAEGDRQESDDDNTRTEKEDADDEDGTREEMGDTNVFSHGFGAQYDAQQEEDDDLQAALSERRAADLAKGKAAAAQQKLAKHLVEFRILLQQVLENSNRMPQVAAASQPDVKAETSSLAQSISDTQDQFMELQSVLEASNHALNQQQQSEAQAADKDAPHETNSAVKSADEQWRRLDSGWCNVQPFIDASIDRWHRKTMLGTGGAALRSKLKSLSQSPSQHVAAMLAEPSKLLARVQLPVDSVQRIGEVEQQALEANVGKDPALDPETFDDSEFYSTLLKEFLEGEAGDQGGNMGAGRTKRKRAVDTRASKGRKIRYDVHSKLVNFMTPEEQHMPSFVSQVFSNLFGRKS